MKPEPSVFVSHASQDKEAVTKLCADLLDADVDTWASFKDIELGANWEISIEEAMDAATHVLIIVSQASISSDYVRSEVQKALKKGKTVIPVHIEDVEELPLRWDALQYVDLTLPENRETAWRALVDQLPKNIRSRFQVLLDNGPSVERIRAFLWQYPQTISRSAISQASLRELPASIQNSMERVPFGVDEMATLEFVAIHGLTEVINNVDFFDIQPGTVGMYRLVYLLSISCPFDAEGNQSAELSRILSDAEGVITSPKLGQARRGRGGLAVTIDVVGGRRNHYRGAVLDSRLKLETAWASEEQTARLKKQLETKLENEVMYYRATLNLMSYDRLLERM